MTFKSFYTSGLTGAWVTRKKERRVNGVEQLTVDCVSSVSCFITNGLWAVVGRRAVSVWVGLSSAVEVFVFYWTQSKFG